MTIPAVTVNQMREVDRIMVEEIGVSIIMMMENASRNIAVFARKLLEGSVLNKTIVILCGKGNNGGDGLGAARHLTNFGAKCEIILSTSPDELRNEPKVQLEVLKHIGVPILEADKTNREFLITKINSADLIIDALLGYNLKGNPREPITTLIQLANQSNRLILAVDIPSGMSGDTGEANKPTIVAKYTLTLALPKVGLLEDMAKEYVGELYLADLSVPERVYEKIGIKIPVIFEKEEVVKISKE